MPEDPCAIGQADENGEASSEKPEEEEPGSKAALAKALKEKNLFVPPPPKPQPPREVRGIFGDRAFINNQWYEEGDTIPPGATLKKINATYVILEWEGKEMKLAPIKAIDIKPRGESGQPEPKAGDEKQSEKIMEAPEEPEPVAEVAAEEGEVDWFDEILDQYIPGHLQEKARRLWEMLPEGEKEAASQELENASEEKRAEMIDEFIERLEMMP